MDITIRLKGLHKDDFDEAEIYVSGINPVQVIGAEPLPGDWDLDEEISEPSTLDDFIEEEVEEEDMEALGDTENEVEEVMEND